MIKCFLLLISYRIAFKKNKKKSQIFICDFFCGIYFASSTLRISNLSSPFFEGQIIVLPAFRPTIAIPSSEKIEILFLLGLDLLGITKVTVLTWSSEWFL